MLLQTNSYIVPKDKRAQHARLVQRFRQTLSRLGCDHFEAYEQVGANWSPADTTGRFVQLMRFRDRKQQLAVQAAERSDPTAQALIKEFCELINFPYQQQQGLFAVGFYHSLLPTTTPRQPTPQPEKLEEPRTPIAPTPEPGEPDRFNDEVTESERMLKEGQPHADQADDSLLENEFGEFREESETGASEDFVSENEIEMENEETR
ncbi:MAG: hypothetical protein JO353_04880 [Phycisphaerae bacterium]|nr:hypothetical protein [Phycisphaerae bacterium]